MIPARPTERRFQRGADSGFTLLELCVVIVIIGIICAIAAPQLIPMISFSELDSEGRWLANFGTAAVSEAALFKEPVIIRFDLDKQIYYAVRLIYPEPETDEEGNPIPPDQMSKLQDMRKSSNISSSQMSNMLAGKKNADPSLAGKMPKDFDQELADQQMNDKFARFSRKMLETRAKNVIHKDGIVSQIGPLFDKKFNLKEEEPTEEEQGGMLARHRIPDGLRVASIACDGETKSRGVVEVEVSPLGLDSYVGFHVVNSDDEWMTVYWDPITGRGVMHQGKLDL